MMSSIQARNETYILFQLAGTTYGVPSASVQQIEMIDHITPVPNAALFVDGVVFARGQVVPVVNLRVRFGFERSERDARTRLIVVSHEERTVGLLVDSASEFATVPENAIKPPPEAITGLSGQYLSGIAMLGDRMILILRISEVLDYRNLDLPTNTVE